MSLPVEDSYLNLPQVTRDENSLNIENIKAEQTNDNELNDLRARLPNRYLAKNIGDVPNVMVYVRPGDDPETQWKIVLPRNLIKPTIKWYHRVTGYPGEQKLRYTLNSRFFHPHLWRYIDKFTHADSQKHKLPGRGYGELPECDLRRELFSEVAVLIGS